MILIYYVTKCFSKIISMYIICVVSAAHVKLTLVLKLTTNAANVVSVIKTVNVNTYGTFI